MKIDEINIYRRRKALETFLYKSMLTCDIRTSQEITGFWRQRVRDVFKGSELVVYL